MTLYSVPDKARANASASGTGQPTARRSARHVSTSGNAPRIDRDGAEAPFAEDGRHAFFGACANDREHALLRLGEHHFVGGHARLAARNLGDVYFHAHAGFGRHLAGRAGEARRAHVLDADHVTGRERL